MPRSIADFAADRARPKRWSDNLSEEVRAAIIDAYQQGFGKHTIARWLSEELGVDDASASKVDTFLRAEGITRG